MISKWKTWSCGTNSCLPFAINAMFNLSIDFIYVKVNLNILSRSQYQLNLQPGVLYLGGRRGKRKVIAAGIDWCIRKPSHKIDEAWWRCHQINTPRWPLYSYSTFERDKSTKICQPCWKEHPAKSSLAKFENNLLKRGKDIGATVTNLPGICKIWRLWKALLVCTCLISITFKFGKFVYQF